MSLSNQDNENIIINFLENGTKKKSLKLKLIVDNNSETRLSLNSSKRSSSNQCKRYLRMESYDGGKKRLE